MQSKTDLNILNIPDLSIGLTKNTINQQLERNEDGTLPLNPKNLLIICLREGLYQYPEMNTKLYLHFKNIAKIQCLQPYKNIKTLYLESNVIKVIQNLQSLTLLENLFLQNNMITKIQNLEANKLLKVINLSHNNLFQIKGLSHLQQLQTLSITNNYLKTIQDLYHLGQCSTTLTSIDLSGNKIQANEKLLDLIPQVKCLYLYGNPLVREMNHYRRTVIGNLKDLVYLDQRTIQKQERLLSQAYIQGGERAFKQARQQILNNRQISKKQSKKQLLQNMDFHRANKIRRFEQNIKECNTQIQSLKLKLAQSQNNDMHYFYENRINQLLIQIKENQQYICNNKKRLSSTNLINQKLSVVKSNDQGFKKNKINLSRQVSIKSQGNTANNKGFNSQILQSISQQESIFQQIERNQQQQYYQYQNENNLIEEDSMHLIESLANVNNQLSNQQNNSNINSVTSTLNQTATATYTGSVNTYKSSSYDQLD